MTLSMDTKNKTKEMNEKKGSRISQQIGKYESLSKTGAKSNEEGERVSIEASRPDIARVVSLKKQFRKSLEMRGSALASSSLNFIMGLVNRPLGTEEEEALKDFAEKLDSPRISKETPSTEIERVELVSSNEGERVALAFAEKILSKDPIKKRNLIRDIDRLYEKYVYCIVQGCPNWLLRICECSLDIYVKHWNMASTSLRNTILGEHGDHDKAFETISRGLSRALLADIAASNNRDVSKWSPCDTARMTRVGSRMSK